MEAINKLDENIKSVLSKVDFKLQKDIQEIRIRENKPLMVKVISKNCYLNNLGCVTFNRTSNSYIVSKEQLENSFKKICEYSLYTYQEEINNGFITLSGGHRVGICGTAVLQNQKIINVKNISSMNIRIARFISHVADEIISDVMNNELKGILICGKPGSGKTTILKDIVNQIASGRLGCIYNVSVIDERGEISSGNNLFIEDYLGDSVDIFNGYSKLNGMMIAIRTMAPDLIICDEIGTKKETQAIEGVLNSGVKVIATIHAGNEEEVYTKPQIRKLISTKAFEKIVILSSGSLPCKISKVISIK